MFLRDADEDKTVVRVDLMACFWRCFSHPKGTMLQVARQFQQQILKYLHSVMLTFDACRREQGVMEDVVKLFI